MSCTTLLDHCEKETRSLETKIDRDKPVLDLFADTPSLLSSNAAYFAWLTSNVGADATSRIWELRL